MKKLALLLLLTSPLQAQSLFPDFIAPAFRGTPGAESTEWDIFSEAYDAPNYGDVSQGASNPSLTQNGTPNAFLTGGFNIYSFSDATAFELTNKTSTALNNVVFQFDTLGSFIDFDGIRLNYTDNLGNATSLSANNFITEYRIITGGFGGFTNRSALQWDLSGLGISNYTITFAAAGSSSSFNAATLDASSATYSEIVPSARVWDGDAGNAKWGTDANWSDNRQTSKGGNVTFENNAASNIDLDLDREVGQLTINKTGEFSLSGSSTLILNTGVKVISAGDATITTNVYLGAHGFLDVAAGGKLEISGPISGVGVTGSYPAAGIYKTGEGVALLSGDNTFTGGISVDGGRLIISGSNTYTGGTAVAQGELVLRGDAPSGAAGTLGNSTNNVAVGVDPATFGPASEAALLIEGNHTVARNISLSTGTNAKVVGAKNATSATFSGNVTLATAANNVILRSANASDVVSFSGSISGGATNKSLTKDGSGTVVFSGASKTYSNSTTVSLGTLKIAAGTSVTGNGAWSVSNGATLHVDGIIGGTGALNLNGGRLTGSGTINKSLTLDSGDILSPGNSPGQINTSSQTWGTGGGYLWELGNVNSTAGTGWDLANIAGLLDISANNTNKFILTLSTLSFIATGFDANADYSWLIATASSGIRGFDLNKFSIDSSAFIGANGSFSLTQTGNDLSLAYYAAVPEPSTWLLLGGGLGLLWFTRRKRISSKSNL